MFICELCKEQQPHGVQPRMIVVDTRPKTYPFRRNVYSWEAVAGRKEEADFKPDDKGGQGFEIVKEVRACVACANERKVAVDASIQATA